MSRVFRLSVFAVLLVPPFLFGQYAEQNVNMVAGTQWPHGDPYLQRQNEPSVAVSTRNPMKLLALTNDYRSVDIPFDTGAPADNEERGDAWIGVFKSRNGGQTWWSDLLDGYPQQLNSTSPLHGYQAGADPVVRSGPDGMFYGSGLVLNRGNNPLSAVFVARWIDNNNTENGDPFSYLGATVIDKGSAGAFLDKEWIAVGPGSGQCTVQGQMFPAQNVYIAYTTFVGGDNNIRTKLMFARSTDCGATWSAPQKLSEGYPINQGAQIVVSPTGPIYVVWRLFKSNTNPNAIMIAKSTDNGQTFTKGATVTTINPFEQGMTFYSIRTNAYPAAAADATGRLYVAWSDKSVSPNGDGRILLMHSLDGVTWNGPYAIDNSAGRGHQFMPAMTSVGGNVTVAYYDLRDDSTIGVFTQPLLPHIGTYVEARKPVGDRGTLAGTDPGSTTYVFLPFLLDEAGHRRHTLDLRATQVTANAMGTTASAPVRVSRYIFGSRGPGAAPSPCGPGCIEQLQFNPPNLPMFRQGTAPFIGDYIDIAGYSRKGTSVYHVVWTDNRDVRPPKDGNWANYTPVGPGHTSTFDGTSSTQCSPGQSGMRNQNIYTTRLTNGIFAGSPGNAKQLGSLASGVPRQRAYAVFVQNATDASKSFRFTITNQPVGGIATFQQFDPTLTPLPVPVLTIDVLVSSHSTATRSVYATSTDPHAQINVDIAEITMPGGSVVPNGLTSTVLINPDVSNPDVSNPDVSNPDVSNPDVSNPDVSNPDVSNSDVHTPDVSNPDVSNPDVSNPDVSNPDVSNPDVSNPDVSNPDVSNPDVSNPDVSNPDVSNPDVSNAALGDSTDTNWTVHNKGNTTSGFAVKLTSSTPVPGGVHTQLIIHRTYQTPTAGDTADGFSGCDLKKENHNQVITNVIDPVITTGGVITTPDAGDATLWLVPGDGARVTLRVYAPRTVFDPVTAVAPVVIAQAKNVVNGVIAPTQSISTAPLQIATTTILDAVSGQPYSQQFTAGGGQPAYTWSSTPTGINQATGLFSGTFVTSDGPQAITVTVSDAAGHSTTKVFPIGVYQPLSVTTQSLPGGSIGQSYNTTILTATGGKTPYAWGVAKGFIPTGMTLDPLTGTLSGTPTQTANEFLTLKVTDSANLPQTATQQYGFTITAPLAIGTTSLPNAAQGFAYSTTLTSTGGAPPIHWSPVSSMPDGMTLSDDGTISGVCPITETPVIQVKATDSNNVSVTSQAMPLTVYSSFCPASIFQLFDNSNINAVSNGGVSPTFSTDGQTYCLDSLITYHYNNASGATPGTIGLTTNCSTSCTILGPWQAVGSAGQGGANENWTAVPAPQVIVMNGAYTVADSDPSTWSQNVGSGGFGFSHVWVKSAVPSTMVAVPATDAAGIGQFVVFNLNGLTSLTGATVTFTDQNGTTGTGFLFTSPSTPSRLWVQLPAGLTNGPLTAKVIDANGNTVGSTTIVQSTTPGVPFIQAIRGVTPVQNSPCGNVNQQTTSTILIGGTIAVSAFGTDTTGAEVQFTQGTYSRIVGTTCGVDSPSIGEAAIIPVPSDLPAGAVNISIRTTVHGATSGWSQPVTVTAFLPIG